MIKITHHCDICGRAYRPKPPGAGRLKFSRRNYIDGKGVAPDSSAIVEHIYVVWTGWRVEVNGKDAEVCPDCWLKMLPHVVKATANES